MGWTDLTRHLASSDERFVVLSFEQIEWIMEMKLPNSARDDRPFWANSQRNNYAKHWMEAGYTVSTRGVPAGRIRFEKTRTAPAAQAAPAGIAARLQTASTILGDFRESTARSLRCSVPYEG